ncbi:putative protein OS=Tsukamurella paurometabola (strain ATCC 8368 / DSM / CCUG 35730 /CIP 100753 / JCM 10117 / KCTC 9821 / NBRC 16120 / NCIMB 702349/ NCTC 13040) OX=521096 GN=Tpau_3850 PE=4 SV=1 [Tsukamurella paurometabola]|uniref:Uncharacterized protein n=1 Tax=Tsukamurella paurometabola (strain ATCC 8368 / DSM 20162 / CCUG 35730 / CIP 100753 / JCM 10117 / KCTC 9821 / NBRC 16120 / NCIMB 702349 / NCTC 13040) TaxID=521096 RepID=D5UMF1_TSUPD|nr:hypothetical protein [Tsukamurella paurometabola]ADG80425.1 hypothetical protein Tpau_3850 [Tsukamurella paurometabola DSM 20162]SUP39592.1 Uncharacterised protein [Tsukamurella paurometabola]
MSPTVTMFGEPVTDPATVADRQGFLTDGFTPLNCGTCGVAVQVRKNSREQTSIQWCGSARDCAVFASDGAGSALHATCPRLMESITRAAKLGAVPIPTPLPSSESVPADSVPSEVD